MKCLFANNFFTPIGGAEKVMWDEARLLMDRGHEVRFFATDRKPYFIEDTEDARYFPRYRNLRGTSTLGKLRYLPEAIYNREAETCLEAFLRDWQPDLAHIHNLHYHLTPSILSACKKQGIPVVMTLHDSRIICPSASLTEDPDFRGLCNTGNPLPCLKKKCKNGSLPETLAAFAEYFTHRNHALYNTVARFITPSAALLELMVNAGNRQREHLVHINNFIDPFFFEQTPVDEDHGYFLYVGRLSREKGVHYLLEAMARLPQTRLRIAGTGPQEEELKSLSAALNLSNVEFLGFQSSNKLLPLFRNCRASILPCNWFENQPLSAIESLALGKPVIASRVGGLPEILDQGDCGILVPPTDVDSLAQAIDDLYRHPEKAHALGRAGRIRARTLYSQEHHIRQLLALYETILSATRPEKAQAASHASVAQNRIHS